MIVGSDYTRSPFYVYHTRGVAYKSIPVSHTAYLVNYGLDPPRTDEFIRGKHTHTHRIPCTLNTAFCAFSILIELYQ